MAGTQAPERVDRPCGEQRRSANTQHQGYDRKANTPMRTAEQPPDPLAELDRSNLAAAMEAARIAAAHPHVLPAEPDWRRAADEFSLSAVMWNALADSSLSAARPEYGHLASDFGQQIGALYRRMAQVAESFAAQAREIAFAEAHPVCEGDCDLDRCPTAEAQGEADDAARDAYLETVLP